MDFGYARVSTKDQNPERQIKILMDLGIEERNIYVEKKSGHNFNRETYDMLVNHIMRPGDRLTVTEIRKKLQRDLQRMVSYHERAEYGYPGSRYENSGYVP